MACAAALAAKAGAQHPAYLALPHTADPSVDCSRCIVHALHAPCPFHPV